MDMSAACTAPIQPHCSGAEEQHPRFSDYMRYRSALNRQMVSCPSFARWLEWTLELENGHEVVFHVSYDPHQRSGTPSLVPGWYKHKFPPGSAAPYRFGPFDERHDAECA